MPRSALEFVPVDHVLPLAGIPTLLERLAQERAAPAPPRRNPDVGADPIEVEVAIAEQRPGTLQSGIMARSAFRSSTPKVVENGENAQEHGVAAEARLDADLKER